MEDRRDGRSLQSLTEHMAPSWGGMDNVDKGAPKPFGRVKLSSR
jgi:hypothetical protein